MTFIIDDILLSMALTHKNYFKLNREKSVDGKEHYFQFKIVMESDNKNVKVFQYIGQQKVLKGNNKETLRDLM